MHARKVKKHRVTVKVVRGAAAATPKDIKAVIGDRIQFSSPDRAFRVVISPWPFKQRRHQVKTRRWLTFVKVGRFKYACFATPRGIGQPEVSGRGANGNVKPPGK